MTLNMNTPDRLLRLAFAATVAGLYLAGVIGGTLALVLGAVALVLLLTSIVSFCPLYAAFGLSTAKKK